MKVDITLCVPETANNTQHKEQLLNRWLWRFVRIR